MTRRCRGCGHRLRLPSPDGYGPVCRARAAGTPNPTPRTIPVAPAAGQLELEEPMTAIAVTTPPYTEADLLNEAARYTADDMDALEILTAMADRAPWNGLDTDAFNEAHNEVVRLAENAADVSYWAVRLGEAGLTPQTPMAWIGTTTGYELAVQVATNPDIKDDVRQELLREIRKAVDATVKSVLCLKDA